MRSDPLAKTYGLDGSENATGDQLKKLDVLANKVFINSLKFSIKIEVMVSEEEVEPVHVENDSSGTKYCIAFDPLDGFSNIDCNVSTGTIFGIYHREAAQQGGFKDILQPGNQLVAAGYCILSHKNMRIPENPKTIYSCNEGNYAHWDRASKAFVDECKNKPVPYNARYVGSMVSDIHRTILYGGIYLYPGSDKVGIVKVSSSDMSPSSCLSRAPRCTGVKADYYI
ncbi:hypothetical protein PC129_g12615 [Phytophthora cactorum]|uniref:fructose-bisphosphatase n=2 Tax=Phytophthora cactorum TaxID=29920 RepID=A0A8T1BWG2_9STRA|nr:hypothetical protein PC111_g16724 [Phytophthora cactorum]KAG2815711.1 hypothetical protein PC112_g13751 [Phytophthora cactorum]KAG2895899.1 hypothetical protein PC114_g15345 [Phytophthora cactorum]KAG2909850.1 hypothetical protein PC115_g13114 [Phytophthora cactorum]KAG2977803.1 hypothetical protein PC118_g12664 [Phytophthora cactorum]